ncbi:MAG: nucleotidyltransferase domain-containing protein [Vulcanimicrobiota bacterium]
MEQHERELAKRFRDALDGLVGSRLARVRAFGSRARGTARPDSDLDLLVLLTGEVDRPTRHSVYDLAYDLSAEDGFLVPLAPLVMSVGDFEELQKRERRLARDITEQGVEV